MVSSIGDLTERRCGLSSFSSCCFFFLLRGGRRLPLEFEWSDDDTSPCDGVGDSIMPGTSKAPARTYSKSITVEAVSEFSERHRENESLGAVSDMSSNTLRVKRSESACAVRLGWRGAGDSRRDKGCHSMPAKNGSARRRATPPTSNMVAFCAPSLRGTCRSNSPFKTLMAPELTNVGNLIFSDRILRCSSLVDGAAKGARPTSISKMRTPRDQKSTGLPYDMRATISGAMYASVPQSVRCRSSSDSNVLASPKSVTTTWPSESMSRFSGFKSRWITPDACKCSSAKITSAA
mmetsp:Transcript_836/g.2684  ORF Transcript_836/g.2684 Transcript_836/m.2684 type:complete len:292 (-) Transcript_836:558-1433(-)